MKSDIEIAQEAVLWPIQKVAEHLDIPEVRFQGFRPSSFHQAFQGSRTISLLNLL